MAREIESQLYRELKDSRFGFIGRGIVEINDIYDAVHRQYPHLCDDDFLCDHTEANQTEPEWKHTVRNALNNSRTITHSGRKGYWVIP